MGSEGMRDARARKTGTALATLSALLITLFTGFVVSNAKAHNSNGCPLGYTAGIDRIVDGDTVDMTVSLGLETYVRTRIRLAGINAPETRGKSKEAGHAATAYLSNILRANGNSVCLSTTRKGKYGRWLGWLTDRQGNSINQQMIDAGHAIPFMAKGSK